MTCPVVQTTGFLGKMQRPEERGKEVKSNARNREILAKIKKRWHRLFDFIVVGSGAGGATVAKELSGAGKKILVLEAGPEKRAGEASSTYSITPSNVEIWTAQCIGGTTMVTMGNAVRSKALTFLNEFYGAAEMELGVSNMPDTHVGPATSVLLESSADWQRMPKAIDFARCKNCGRCSLGCPNGAKWDSSSYLAQAEKNGAKIKPSTKVKNILARKNCAYGVETFDGNRFEGSSVILSAGALETPRILMRSGIGGVGRGLFVDTFMTVGGIRRDIGLNRELGMGAFIMRNGYLISPHYSSFMAPYLSSKGFATKPGDLLSLMIKIEDEPSGEVAIDNVYKTNTKKDVELLDRGRNEAADLLRGSGVEEGTIVSTFFRGAHPGGTCAEAVDRGFETEVQGLRIADASIIEGPFGLPPMLTVVAMAKKLSVELLGRA
jgi:choline dehydrogenase-like flavoprotein